AVLAISGFGQASLTAAKKKLRSLGYEIPAAAARDAAPVDESLALVEALTHRELEVLGHIAAGDSNQTIAEKLVITISAVKKHTSNIFGKLNVNSRTQAVARARQLGLLPAD
ncbi:MAG TPA: LuxR C-terminal-related transcriptional regulator, partial [Anaerolineales bacterium]